MLRNIYKQYIFMFLPIIIKYFTMQSREVNEFEMKF